MAKKRDKCNNNKMKIIPVEVAETENKFLDTNL